MIVEINCGGVVRYEVHIESPYHADWDKQVLIWKQLLEERKQWIAENIPKEDAIFYAKFATFKSALAFELRFG